MISDLLYRPETVTIVIGVGAVLIISRSLLAYQKANDQLLRTLKKLDKEIRDREQGLPEARQRVNALEVGVPPLREKVRMLNLYFDKVNEIWSAAEMKEARKEESKAIRGSVEAPETGRRPGRGGASG